MVSILLGVWNGSGVCCCCPARCGGVARALLIPLQCWRVLLSCRALFLARCCGVRVVDVCLCCSCGGVSSVCPPPLVVVVGGAIVDGGVLSWMVGGMVSEGRQCYCPPVECRCPPSVCWRPPCRLPCGPIEWRGVVCAVMPCIRIGPAPCIVLLPLVLPTPPSFCVCCHSIVGLGLCLCDRVMLLRNGGGGLCWVEGRVVPAVHCQLLCVVMCVSVWCVRCLVVLCCGLWNGGGVGESVRVCGLVACLPFLFLVVGVRGSARAALRARTLSPNTIVSLLLCSPPPSSFCPRLSSCPAFLYRSSFFLLEWRCVIHHVSVCCVGMTAMGSLSRSSLFFW